jgi:EpsI family protein
LSDRIEIQAGGRSIPANRYVAVNNGQRAVILYWYQTSQRAVASEWTSKFWTVWDAFSAKRTDIALVRVVLWPNGEDYAKSTADGVEFTKEMYPVLQAALPR